MTYLEWPESKLGSGREGYELAKERTRAKLKGPQARERERPPPPENEYHFDKVATLASINADVELVKRWDSLSSEQKALMPKESRRRIESLRLHATELANKQVREVEPEPEPTPVPVEDTGPAWEGARAVEYMGRRYLITADGLITDTVGMPMAVSQEIRDKLLGLASAPPAPRQDMELHGNNPAEQSGYLGGYTPSWSSAAPNVQTKITPAIQLAAQRLDPEQKEFQANLIKFASNY